MRYIGNGAFLAGIPARDLTEDEVKLYTATLLLASGLYVLVDKQLKKGG